MLEYFKKLCIIILSGIILIILGVTFIVLSIMLSLFCTIEGLKVSYKDKIILDFNYE